MNINSAAVILNYSAVNLVYGGWNGVFFVDFGVFMSVLGIFTSPVLGWDDLFGLRALSKVEREDWDFP